ncbi:YfjP family GTPase [Streptomyces sp. RS10V-4]|uniref:YfjP family GTPase n=1 Tax=Streptomyces rhizoryzae TaxID=2932493 RepID=UPI002003C041|nr:YfjP family GTPase [Streptomyces rhizoryzae]MCK7625390.1 YfjP family GTPase [Streptomyces rhizoryzae]
MPGGTRRAAEEGLRPRLEALRELIALSRSRLEGPVLDEAGRVLEAADERYRLSGEHTVVALAGATGSGKSSLFNALAGAVRSEVGARRPTTAEPVACVWSGGRPGAEGLLRRLGVPVHRRHTAQSGPELSGLVLLDLPDHDSSATVHREQVDRLLKLVDAVIWVVDPEKYADAVLHERYLRPLAGYAEVTFVVLNQVDRLPGDAADQVVDDLRRLLDEDGLALGEHGEPGATVLALSAATGEGVAELREALAHFVAERGAADRRLAADVDAAAERLRPVYVAESRVGLTGRAREEFEDRLAEAVGAVATGRTAERDWLRHAERACGSPWSQLRSGRKGRGARRTAVATAAGEPVATDRARIAPPRTGAGRGGAGHTGAGDGGAGHGGMDARGAGAVRTGGGEGDAGGASVPAPGHGSGSGPRTGPGSGPGTSAGTDGGTRADATTGAGNGSRTGARAGTGSGPVGGQAARPMVEQAVRAVAAEAARGLPVPWAQAVREAAVRGADGLPEALDAVAAEAEEALRRGPEARPRWWTVAAALQGLLFVFQVVGVLWLVGAVTGVTPAAEWPAGLLPAVVGSVGGPALTWLCGALARGPARRYGQDAERRLREAAAGRGRARVLEPVAAELLRYREVRERYAVASGA